MLGDSLTAGYGLRPEESLPARLRVELAGLGRDVDVVNAGISGDTTADGLRRLDRSVPDGVDLCIVARGANDMMRFVPPDLMRRNLDAILDRLAERDVPALLCGMRAPPWFGLYAVAFDAVFGEVAARRRIPLYPFLLEGIALDPSFSLPDRIHPNALGIQRVAQRLAGFVAPFLERPVRGVPQTGAE